MVAPGGGLLILPARFALSDFHVFFEVEALFLYTLINNTKSIVPTRLSPPTTSLSIEGHDVDNQVGSAIQQHDVSSDQDVCALRRRRSQAYFQILGYGLQAFLEAWRQCATHHQLFL